MKYFLSQKIFLSREKIDSEIYLDCSVLYVQYLKKKSKMTLGDVNYTTVKEGRLCGPIPLHRSFKLQLKNILRFKGLKRCDWTT